MLGSTIVEGSTIVMTSIDTSTQNKSMRIAIADDPRGERASWMLTVQVGNERICPLAWSIESGVFGFAKSILQDL